MTDQPDNPFAALDAAIEKVTTRSKLETEKKRLLGKASNTRSQWQDRADAKRELALVDAQIEQLIWYPVAAVALFTEQRCDYCGSVHRIFLQHMEEQHTQAGSHVSRLIRVPRPRPDLPRRVVLQVSLTHFCADCCGDFNFSLVDAEEKFKGYDAFAVSGTYVQEEL